jgi:hypothetical protein
VSLENRMKPSLPCLEVLAVLDALGECGQEGSTHVCVEHRKAINLGVIGVPLRENREEFEDSNIENIEIRTYQSNDAAQGHFADQQTVHPSQSKLKILNPIGCDVMVKWSCYSEKDDRTNSKKQTQRQSHRPVASTNP